jgi:hypothetical protein
MSTIACPSCTFQNPGTNRFCAECGHRLPEVAPPSTGTTELVPNTPATSPLPGMDTGTNPPVQQSMKQEMASVLEAVLFPFQNPNWPVRLFWVPFVLFIPVIGLIVMRGWRLDITRRMSMRNPDRLPQLGQLGRFFGDGVVLWMMTGIYAIPLLIILTLFAPNLMQNILTTLLFIWSIMTNDPTMSFAQFATDILIGLLTQAGAPIAYQLISLPIYRTAMLRYSITGNMLVFFDVITSIQLCQRYFSGVMGAVFATIAANVAIVTISGFFTATVVGAILVPLIIFPLGYWVVGYIYGRLAMEMTSDLR